jgi:hypothetical protein
VQPKVPPQPLQGGPGHPGAWSRARGAPSSPIRRELLPLQPSPHAAATTTISGQRPPPPPPPPPLPHQIRPIRHPACVTPQDGRRPRAPGPRGRRARPRRGAARCGARRGAAEAGEREAYGAVSGPIMAHAGRGGQGRRAAREKVTGWAGNICGNTGGDWAKFVETEGREGFGRMTPRAASGQRARRASD